MKYKLLAFITTLIALEIQISFAQTVIQMKKEGGVYTIPCKVNGLPLKFIFDTGASDVSISATEALFMLKNGYLNSSDIIGTQNYIDATGKVSEGTKIMIRNLEFSGLILTNVEASVVNSLNAPLLLGQSALSKLGKILLDYSNNTLTVLNGMENSTQVNKKSNLLESVRIGTQIWSQTNLDVEYFRNGDVVPQAKSDEEWEAAGQNGKPAWCYYTSASTDYGVYGKLYNWYAVVDLRGLAPNGWHIPNDGEWRVLSTYLGGDLEAGGKLKEKGFSHWLSPNLGAINYGNFTGLPGGFRDYIGTYHNIGKIGYWWSITEKDTDNASYVALYNNNSKFGFYYHYKRIGFSVRCIKD